MTPTLLYLLLGGGAFAVTAILLFAFGGEEATRKAHLLTRVAGTAPVKKLDGHKSAGLRRATADSGIPLLDRLIKALMPNADKLRKRLACTGFNLTVGEYLLINAVSVAIAILAFTFLAHWPKPVAVFLGIAVGLYIPHFVTGFLGKRRLKKFLGNFPEAIDTICRGLRSGLPVSESIAAVGREMPDPVGIEFRRIADGVRMGRSQEDSMWEVTRRVDTPEFRFLIIAMAIQKETGGNLAETLGHLSELIRRRRQLKLKIRAMSSEARASAMIIGSLPFIMFTLLYLVNKSYVLILFNSTGGNILLGFGLGMITLGWAVMGKMINFEI
ncbi:MAG TPA: type II secretion system F family protein [Alphaproteobacteria bacterium]|nr:type II secretion system F family protein [Alphaproteobacteria bacterium]